MSLKEKILADIKKNHICPRPRWQYICLHSVLIASGILTIVAGSFAYSFVLLHFSLPERAYFDWLSEQDRPGLIVFLPYLWIVGVIIALGVGYVIFSKTDRAYRYHASILTSILVLGSMLGGLILYVTHIAEWSDETIQHFGPPQYGQMRRNLRGNIPRIEEGTLPIRIQKIDNGIYFGNAPDRQMWEVHMTCINDICRQNVSQIQLLMPVIFEGDVVSKGVFEAEDVRFPGRGQRGMIIEMR